MGQTALSDSVRAIEAEIAAGRPEQALAICQDAQARYPRALAVQRVMGEVYLAMRKTREAVAALDRALAGNPDDARACCARAIVQQIQGDSMGALAWYRRACDTRPDDNVLRAAYRELAASLSQPPYAPTRMGLARLYLRGDLYPHAIREFETLLAEQPDALEAQVGLAETFWRAQRTQAAAERCRRILVNTPSCVKALLILAAAELAASNGEEARRLVKRVAELDPEQRIGQELFADQLAAGDRALRVLLFGDEPVAAPAPSVPQPRPQTSAQSQPLRPAVASQPHPPAQSQPLYQPPASRPATQSQPVAPAASTQPRPMNLPPDFHTIFAETEYMLWGHDEETVGRMPSISGGQPRPDSFAGSSVFVPPALQQQGGPLDDTEARAAINWVSWLQAQGARPHGGMPQGIPGATGPLPPPPAGTGPLVPPPTGPLPWELSASYAPPQNGMAGHAQPRRGDTGQLPPPPPTGPLPPPTPEALRQMFAELEPEPSNSRIVDSDLVVESAPAADVGYDHDHDSFEAETDGAVVESMPVEPVDSPATAFAAFAAQPASEPAKNGDAPPYEPSWSDSQAADMGWTLSDNLPESFAHLEGPDADGTEHAEHTERHEDIEHGALAASSVDGSWSAPTSVPETPEGGVEHADAPDAPLTLEALEHGFTSSGFQSFELHPGGLAAMVSATDEDTPRGSGVSAAVPEPAAESQREPHNVAQTEPPASHAWSSAEGTDVLSTAYTAPAEPWAVGEQATGPLDAEVPDTEPLAFGASQPPAMEAFPHAPPAQTPAAGEWGEQEAKPSLLMAQPEPGDDGAAFSGRPSFPPAHAPAARAVAQPASEPALAADDYTGRLALARQRRGDGRMDDALAEYRIVLKNSPDLLSDVMNDLRASLAEQPDHPEVHRLLGDAHIRQGDYLSALESYNRAVALTQALGN